jgi:hypothetical protein
MTDEETCEREKLALLINACDVAAKQYEDYWNAFANLDEKAVAVATIAGIVLAAVVAFLTEGKAPAFAQESWQHTALILEPPLLALIAIISSLLGSRVRELVAPFDAPARIEEAKLLGELECGEFSLRRVINYYNEQLKLWSKAIESIGDAVGAKADRVLFGQWYLIASISFLVVLFVLFLLGPVPAAGPMAPG